jgi:hypothetical protein
MDFTAWLPLYPLPRLRGLGSEIQGISNPFIIRPMSAVLNLRAQSGLDKFALREVSKPSPPCGVEAEALRETGVLQLIANGMLEDLLTQGEFNREKAFMQGNELMEKVLSASRVRQARSHG